ARTVAIEPQVLLLDEPLSNLDASLRVQMRRELLALQRKLGLTTVFVTHDQEEANTTSDRMAVLDGGVIQQIGTPQELYDRPANGFVAGFLGTANILKGSLRDGAFVTESGNALPVATTLAAASRIVLRPQNISLTDDSGPGVIPGAIRHREFLGSQIRYLVDTADGQIIVDRLHGEGAVAHEAGVQVALRVESRNAPLLA
ncbi:polyamine ABC transporter ATP-binding protein, partial [Cereibacter changlensis JA139]